jgi:hypothetical protein
MSYRFYGWQEPVVIEDPELPGIRSQRDLYDILAESWCAETCTPRMRKDWSDENKTLGQCSITAFLVQDICGGQVFGIPLHDGNFHCFNVVDGHTFDLTSEQFPDQLDYSDCYEQFREKHFARQEKRERYELLKSIFLQKAGKTV